MRIRLLVPGTGHYYCGSCLRDHALAQGLMALGHDVVVLPLYLPLVLEEPPANGDARVFLGGINLFLEQKSRLWSRAPRALARLLDSPRLLRWVSRRAEMTDPAELGALTHATLRGEEDRQSRALDELVGWMRADGGADVVLLSNAMLLGIAGRLARELGAPIACSLQGEAPFLDALPEPWRARCWRTLGERARDADLFVGVSRWYAEHLRERLDLDPARLHVVRNGIDQARFAPAAAPPERPTLGYLARMCPDKGLETLVEAFLMLRERHPDLHLRAAGVLLDQDRRWLAGLRSRIESAGHGAHAEFLPNLTVADKHELLRGLSLFSVPATYGESFGLYLLEALASGVPVVQPRHGAFPELLEETGGGLLCEPDDPASLAAGLDELLADPERARSLGARGRVAVAERFDVARMAREVEALCRMLAER